ncbi:MAG: MFS transporter, partial [Proteobacteria bacterium]|nr:MFS transporter [Pseudomonadota bacterium]
MTQQQDKPQTISSMTKWLITITVMLAAMIEIIDTTIVNVALPDMAGSLGANTEEISWVVTSYIVSSAICMPLTGFFVRTIGRRRLLLINIIGFLIFSMLCGLSSSLGEMVFFRIMQGIFGASLVPLSQYVLRD